MVPVPLGSSIWLNSHGFYWFCADNSQVRMVEAITAHFWVPEASKSKRLDALNGEFARRILRTAGELGLGYIGRLKEAGSRIRVDTSTSDGPAPGRLVELEIPELDVRERSPSRTRIPSNMMYAQQLFLTFSNDIMY